MTVFADAFFWIALLNRRDVYHERVKRFASEFHAPIVTTQWVLTEVADAIASSAARRSIMPFFLALAANNTITVLDANANCFRLGVELYHERPDKGWSLTDCISFVVMKEHNLTDALTGDRHFAQAGFRPVFE